MTCIKAQSMITPFINNKLNIKEMEEFLDHVDSCNKCMEELEFYYALLTAMKQLDEDKNLSGDFRMELSVKIKKSRDKIMHVKYTYYRKITILILLMMLLAFLLGISYAKESGVNTPNVTKSDFNLRKSFYDERFHELDGKLEEYLNKRDYEKDPGVDVTPNALE